ncbi:MAG: alkylhydroperoxidase [Sphingobacteriales bacterium]|nr:MAG: alkylhydroperoxidase [Sphingobacteriales bacterium]
MNETIVSIFDELGIDATHDNFGLQRLAAVDSKFLRDLKLNVIAVLGSSNYKKKETALLALAVAVNEKNEVLIQAFGERAAKEGATEAELAETHACTALMNTNNVFYRFRHYMEGMEYYNNQPAGLRMSSMMNPVMGKEFFEMMSLVISAINNCERCITSHEASVKQHGATEQRIYDGVRLGAVIKSLCVVI